VLFTRIKREHGTRNKLASSRYLVSAKIRSAFSGVSIIFPYHFQGVHSIFWGIFFFLYFKAFI